MKTKKIILTLVLAVLTAFVFISCTEDTIFMNSIIKETKSFNVVSSAYESEDVSSFENIKLDELSNDDFNVTELSVSDDLIQFNEKRLALLAIHEEILIEIETIKELYNSIQTSVESIDGRGYDLLQGDKDIIKVNIVNIRQYHSDLMDTQGQAYRRIYELNGSYTRENLSSILVVFDEVYEVLEYRLETLKLAVIEFENIDSILADYMES